jgi:PAS domain S-box-containing protein
VEQAPVAIAMFDRRMICLAASRIWIRDYGRGRTDVVGLNHYEVHPDIPPGWRLVHEKALAGEALHCDEELWLQADGSRHWLRWAVQPWRNRKGEVGGIIIHAENITDRKRASEALIEQEQRLAGIVDSAMDAIITVDAEQRVVLFNRAAEAIFGWAADQALGQSLDAFIPDRFRARHREHIRHFASAGVTTRAMGALGALRALRASGEEFPIEASISQVVVAGQRLYTVILRDITGRERSRRRERVQHRLTELLAEAASLYEVAARIVQAICEETGFDLGALWELEPRTRRIRLSGMWHTGAAGLSAFESHTRASDFAPEAELPGRVWATGQPIIVRDAPSDPTYLRGAAAGQAGMTCAFGFPLVAEGEVVGVLDLLCRRLSDMEPELLALYEALGSQIAQFVRRRQAERQFLQAQRLEAVGRLAGGIAHDFNNLLGIMLGYAGLAATELGEAHPVRPRLDAIVRAATRAGALTRQILTFSRKEAVASSAICDVNRIVEDLEDMIRRLIGEKVSVELRLAGGLGQVRIDSAQLEQVLMNLSVNARDAMPEGGRLLIETSGAELDEAHARSRPEARPGRYVMLAVSDTGHGMDAATIERIFDPFFTTKPTGQGTGLGLAVVYGAVKQSGGYITVYSEPGHGTTFKVYLPRAAADDQADAGGAQDEARGGHETLLLVEDEAELRSVVAEALRDAGYRVLEADGAEQALELAGRAEPIHLVISDVVLPRSTGPETTAQIVQRHAEARVLLMSGYTDGLVAASDGVVPGMAFIGKPFTIGEFLRKVRGVLDTR